MPAADVDYALQTLMSKIKERELESQRALNEYDVTNRHLKSQLRDLQEKFNEKDRQLSEAHETIRTLRGVTQIVSGLQEEIRALRNQLLPGSAPDYITQNSTSEHLSTTLLNVISDCGRTTEVAVQAIKEVKKRKVDMDGSGGGGGGEEWGEEGESEGRAATETGAMDNDNEHEGEGEWEDSFDYNMAGHSSGDPGHNGFSSGDAYSRQPIALELTNSSASCSSDIISTPNSRKRPMLTTQMDGYAASMMVQAALRGKLGGDRIIQEYSRMKCLCDRSRRKMVNILVADMMETQGRHPPASVRESYALGIVTLFPLLKDLNSKNGYEHYYDSASGSGYLAWRLKTVQRNSCDSVRRTGLSAARKALLTNPDGTTRPAAPAYLDGPRILRAAHSPPPPISPPQCQEAVNLMMRLGSATMSASDAASVKENMRITFQHRQDIMHDPAMATPTSVTSVLDIFPRFLDTPGLIGQDFAMLFGKEVSSRFLSQWQTFYKPRIIADCKRLPHGTHMDRLLALINQPSDWSEWSDDWDSDLATIFLLLHLLPPTSQGRKHKKISAAEATDHLVKFLQAEQSIENFLEVSPATAPYLLCVGERRSSIQRFFIVVQGKAIPCEPSTNTNTNPNSNANAATATANPANANGNMAAVRAFDELFKSHFVFSQSYDEPLCNFFTFMQTTVYGIDVGQARESPRVREIRARLLHNNQ
ncbi:uncharacterized protein LOC134449289 isoform X2 [Engraulis encrasicolus]|uniref:uncharacterized protein LOC134449289 isoform X2 n=1 Tax=Engraulis encrasicolus TaxID=184585 RepID=UPI002FD5FDF7